MDEVENMYENNRSNLAYFESTQNHRLPNEENDLEQSHMSSIEEIEQQKFGWLHIKICLVTGIGFFTDAYDIFIINIVMLMMGCVYFINETGKQKNTVPVYIDTLIKASKQVGILIGQLLFGIMADKFGRKKLYGIELMIIVLATFASVFSASTVSGVNIFVIFGIWRVLLGFGCGGDYPLSAIITSEFASTKRRGLMMATVFSMQGFGMFVGSLVPLVVLGAFKQSVYKNQENLDHVWRLCASLSIIPGILGVYFRLTIQETPRFKLALRNEKNKNANLKEFCVFFRKWKHLKLLLGTSICWFVLDVAFYGINLNTSIIIEAIGFSGSLQGDVWKTLFKNSIGNFIITLLGLLPGYFAAIFLVDRLGRKKIQLIGFLILTILFVIFGFAYEPIKKKSVVLFVVIFTLAQFFFNFGPNATTFIIPGEVFPTKYRSTAYGISAAAGKLGAIISQVGFFQMKDLHGKNNGIPIILQIFSGFMLVGFLFTFLLPETKGKTLEELSQELDESNSSMSNSSIVKKLEQKFLNCFRKKPQQSDTNQIELTRM